MNVTISVMVLIFFTAVLGGLILLTMVIISSIAEYYAIQALIGSVLISCLATILFLTKGLMPVCNKILP
jgi:membrane-associated HD superfamily phosphohydrolase